MNIKLNNPICKLYKSYDKKIKYFDRAKYKIWVKQRNMSIKFR